MVNSPGDITDLLRQWSAGDRDAFERLIPLIYDELRRVARRFLIQERQDHTIQSTALVHELYLKLVDQDRAQWQDRAQFFSVAAKMMRRIMVDHARKEAREKRGGGVAHAPIEDALDAPTVNDRTMLAVDAALTRFAALDPARSQIVEMRYFGGFELDEIANLLQVSRTTVKRQWNVARMWLHRELETELDGRRPLDRN